MSPPTNFPPSQNQIWAIGGGKGGIGKSFISSSLAICLSKLGKKVTLVDLDLGSANLHTVLGIKAPQQTLSDFVKGRAQTLNEVLVDTEIPGLSFISGFNDSLDVANVSQTQINRIVQSLRALPTPYVILDLGAGTADHTLDFFLAADQKIVAATPEPTSIENAYRFMKSSFYRKLKNAEVELGIHELVEAAMDGRAHNGIRSPADLIAHLKTDAQANNPSIVHRLEEEFTQLHMHILLNQIRTRGDIEIGHSMKSVSKKYFGMEIDYLGYIDHDNAVWQSLRKKRPLLIEFPYSSIVGQFLGITKNLLNPHALRAVV
jgi:flagellar biosynthesis protein FlhG